MHLSRVPMRYITGVTSLILLAGIVIIPYFEFMGAIIFTSYLAATLVFYLATIETPTVILETCDTDNHRSGVVLAVATIMALLMGSPSFQPLVLSFSLAGLISTLLWENRARRERRQWQQFWQEIKRN